MNHTAEEITYIYQREPYCISGSGDDENKIYGEWIYRVKGR